MRRLPLSTLLLGVNAALVLLAVVALAAAEAHHLLLALGLAAIAILFGVLLSRQLAEPVRALTQAAARMGRGDLATPLPRLPEGAGLEVATLASTMEEMRRRLFGLTAELRRRQAEAETILSGIAMGVFAVDRDRRVR
jgi:nitrogen fixation/metabolism regulation signal transduction histidine kinase